VTGGDRADWGWLVEGYRRALARFDATADKRDQPMERFIPLFETLNWVIPLMDYPDGRLPDDDVVTGLRYARNRIHHDIVDALEPRDVPNPPGLVIRATGGSKIVAPPVVLDWFWKSPDELPEPDKSHRTRGKPTKSVWPAKPWATRSPTCC